MELRKNLNRVLDTAQSRQDLPGSYDKVAGIYAALGGQTNLERALELYRAYQELYNKGVEAYVKEYGPLNHTSRTEGDRYLWLDDPWPWDYQGNKD